MWLKFFVMLSLAGVSLQAYGQCREANEGLTKKFVCADGTVQKVTIVDKQVVVFTYSPETKSWSETRFPAPDGATNWNTRISVREGG